MKAASVQEIKQELKELKPAALIELCLRLSRFKKENKELLTYLLFEAHREEEFIQSVKEMIDAEFATMNTSHLYFAKKTLRKIVRHINKYCRYSGKEETELELRLYFCEQLDASGIPYSRQPVINNLYAGQVKKCNAVLDALHEDLQYEYRKRVGRLKGKD